VILVDTHVVIWLALEPAKISKKATAAIEDSRRSDSGLAISDITLFEISMIENRGRLKLDTSLETFLSEVEARFVVLPITDRVCVRATELPAAYPRDPADRIIGATALAEGIPLVTADNDIRSAKTLRTIW
jgi:PIN domain nuclease of toxin-antitoxin system